MQKKLPPFETIRDCRVLSASGGLPNLLRYETFAVADYGYMSHALQLRQTRQSLNLGVLVVGRLLFSYCTRRCLTSFGGTPTTRTISCPWGVVTSTSTGVISGALL
jgi:hypothetical protein